MPTISLADQGYSGATLRRPGLEGLRDLLAAGRVERILITAPDRLARNSVHQVLLIEELQRFGAVVEFLDRAMSPDPHDQLLLQIRGAVAEYERTLIAERMRRGRLRKLQAGLLLPWTRVPYGFRVHPDRPRDPAGVRVDPAEGAVIGQIFTQYLQEGSTLTSDRQRVTAPGDSLAQWPVPLDEQYLALALDQSGVYRAYLCRADPRAASTDPQICP
jgi:site-specific DNA recombinase